MAGQPSVNQGPGAPAGTVRQLYYGDNDGRIPLEGGLTAICSVKSGRVSVTDVREFKGLLNDKQVAWVLITRQLPTRPMRELAQQSGLVAPEQEGLYRPDPFPRIQTLTREQILTGQRPRLPYAT